MLYSIVFSELSALHQMTQEVFPMQKKLNSQKCIYILFSLSKVHKPKNSNKV